MRGCLHRALTPEGGSARLQGFTFPSWHPHPNNHTSPRHPLVTPPTFLVLPARPHPTLVIKQQGVVVAHGRLHHMGPPDQGLYTGGGVHAGRGALTQPPASPLAPCHHVAACRNCGAGHFGRVQGRQLGVMELHDRCGASHNDVPALYSGLPLRIATLRGRGADIMVRLGMNK